MAAYNQKDYLHRVGLDGFAIIEKHYGRHRHTPPPPPSLPSGRQDHHQKLAPNQYQEPPTSKDAATTFGSYRPAPAAAKQQCYETWYFLPVPQAPMKEGTTAISSGEAAKLYGGTLFADYGGYKSKLNYRRAYY